MILSLPVRSMVVLTTLSFMLEPESVDRTAQRAAEVWLSMTFMVVLLPSRLVQREAPMMPRIQGGATMVF